MPMKSMKGKKLIGMIGIEIGIAVGTGKGIELEIVIARMSGLNAQLKERSSRESILKILTRKGRKQKSKKLKRRGDKLRKRRKKKREKPRGRSEIGEGSKR